MDEAIKQFFLKSSEDWLCDSYSLDVRYLAKREDQRLKLLQASISFAPLRHENACNFHFDTPYLIAGMCQYNGLKLNEILNALQLAIEGTISITGKPFSISAERGLSYFTEMLRRDLWYNHLHLRVSGDNSSVRPPNELLEIDSYLQLHSPPFDGLQGLINWLDLEDAINSSRQSKVDISIFSPVDLILEKCILEDNKLSITMHAHSEFNPSKMSLAVIPFPGNALDTRLQVASAIQWGESKGGIKEGFAEVQLVKADSVEMILMLGPAMVRRQWFLDSSKARNTRLLATRLFDKDLKRVCFAVLDQERDQDLFERGVASLLFLLGFSLAIQVETNAPDLVVISPSGTYLLVECTLKISDFHLKSGKLVDRRAALEKALSLSGHQARVEGALVCALPKDQIAEDRGYLARHRIVLLSKEDLESALNSLEFPNPDQILEDALSKIVTPQLGLPNLD